MMGKLIKLDAHRKAPPKIRLEAVNGAVIVTVGHGQFDGLIVGDWEVEFRPEEAEEWGRCLVSHAAKARRQRERAK